MSRATQRAAAATLVAELEAGPLHKDDLRHVLGASAWTFGRALAQARLAAYVSIEGGVVSLTEKGKTELRIGRAEMTREQRRRLDRRRRAS